MTLGVDAIIGEASRGRFFMRLQSASASLPFLADLVEEALLNACRSEKAEYSLSYK